MNNNFFEKLEDYLKNVNAKDEKELEAKVQEFVNKYNSEDFDYELTPLECAYQVLDKAEKAKSKKTALKYAKEAYEISHDCLDAILLQVSLEDNPFTKWTLLDNGLECERKRLEKEGYFKKDKIGDFYGYFETRPYIRGLCFKIDLLILEGKIKQARDLCKEVLKLNDNDNTGRRYVLLAIYAYLEEEEESLKLLKKYPEESFTILFTLAILYYKLGKDEKTQDYLKKANKANPNLLKFFKGTMKDNPKILEGFYKPGDSSEINMYFQEYCFLLATVPELDIYAREVLKNK